jgi:hydroxyacyl-ACP dehydratase HTD2-like protein with hotdog domain
MSGPSIETVSEGDVLPGRALTCTEVELFLYNAVLFNAHRIHYDLPYATGVEGYPGLVIAGPQIGDWMVQCADDWAGEGGMVVNVAYSNRLASYIGETLTTGGTVTEVDRESGTVKLEMFVKNEAGDVVTPGTVTVRLEAS